MIIFDLDGAPGIDGVVIDPWGHSATLDEALLNGLLHAGHNPEEPGDEEVEAGREAARAGDWRMAADHYDEAAQHLFLQGHLHQESEGNHHGLLRFPYFDRLLQTGSFR